MSEVKELHEELNNNLGVEINYNKDYDVIIKSFFEKYGIIYNQLDSYEKFIERGIPQVLKDHNPQTIILNVDELTDDKYKIELYYHNSHINKPILPQNDDTTIDLDPLTSRLKNCTYSSNLYIDIDINISKYNIEQNIYEIPTTTKLTNINIGKIPIMVGSKYCILKKYKYYTNNDFKECEFDKGGYFIINGSEKVIVFQERIAENRIYSFKNNKSSKYVEMVEIKSIIPGTYLSPSLITAKILSRDDLKYPNCIYITFPYLKSEIPMLILYKALGITTDKEIYLTILYDISQEYNKELKQILNESIDKYSYIKTEADAKLYIAKIITNPQDIKNKDDEYICNYIDNLIKLRFLPHVKSNFKCKGLYLGYMIRKLLLVYLKRIPYDDRDNYINKRVDTTGILLTNLFKLQYMNMLKEVDRGIKKEFITGNWKSCNNINKLINKYNIYKIFKGTTIENGIKTAISTGNFGSSNSQFSKSGVAQLLNRLSFFSVISHLRRINTPIEKSGKLVTPRKLNGSSYGYICPNETPEGASIGLLKHMATSAIISSYYSSDHILHILKTLNIILFNDIYTINYSELLCNTKMFINGDWIGYAYNSMYIYNQLKYYKHNGIINIYTAIVLDHKLNEIHINTDAGRCIRPLYILKNNRLLINADDINKLKNNIYKWDNLVCNNLNNYVNELNINNFENNTDLNSQEGLTKIEFVDIFESSYTLISTKNLLENNINNIYSYCEIHSCLLLGIIANLIPFSNHNQAPRNVYQSAMGKQAIGIYSSKYYERLDTVGHVMSYPQNPIVNTFINKYIDNYKLPHGQNLIVAVICGRENQEDSILINKSCVERGLLHTEHYSTFIQKEERQSFNDEEKFCIPNPENTISMKKANYSKLGTDGFITKGSYVEAGDVIIGKCIPIKKETSQYKNKDASIVLKNNGGGIITNVYNGQNSDGYNFVKIQIRDQRIPIVGDKLSSRHGQKGIIGQLIPNEDMPLTRDGITPDIIINVHCLPSRMTVAHIHESNFSVLCSLLGYFGDATPFADYNPDDIYELLENNGLNKCSDQILFNGITGEQMDAQIFMGITHYQRLKHMVCEKEHSRATGPIVNLNRQPSEGRNRDGGFRFGEMECWCYISITPISVHSGRSIEIGKLMGNCGENSILSFNEEFDGIVPETQLNFRENGKRKCVKITFEDGRTLTLTPNHKLLTSNNEYIEAGNLKIGEDRVKCGITYPTLDIEQEMTECNNWKMDLGYIVLKTDTSDEFLRTLAFMRILGYLITDGHISNKSRCSEIYIGHKLDLEQIIKDLNLFIDFDTNKYIKKKTYIYTIRLPKYITHSIIQIQGIIRGNKLDSNLTGIPDFILYENCPYPIIREFLGGMFGGDGHSPCIFYQNDRLNNTEKQQKLKQLKEEYNTTNNSISKRKQTILKKQNNINKQHGKKPSIIKELTRTLNNCIEQLQVIEKNIIYIKECINLLENEIENSVIIPNSCTNIAFSKTKYIHNIKILQQFFNQLQYLLLKFNINTKISNNTETFMSKNNMTTNNIKRFEMTLTINIDCSIKFSEEIGFRYCCHKNHRLEAVISYYRLKEIVLRQRNYILNYIIEKGNYIEFIKNPKNKNFAGKPYMDKAIEIMEQEIEPIIHNYVKKTRIRIDDYVCNKTFEITQYKNICTSGDFPIIGEYLTSIDAYKWFREEINNNETNTKIDEETDEETNEETDIKEIKKKYKKNKNIYAVHADSKCLPTMNLKVIDIRDAGEHDVYDIEVENNHSYLANGIVSHNCMISHGTSNMYKERMLDVSDHFKTYTCNNCGNFANVNKKENIYECVYCNNKLDFSEIHIPYPCKLFFQELQSMAITPRIFTK